jgi:hypothetical protein
MGRLLCPTLCDRLIKSVAKCPFQAQLSRARMMAAMLWRDSGNISKMLQCARIKMMVSNRIWMVMVCVLGALLRIRLLDA